ncbi:hypothetical protein MCHI_001185 [Candidatus Magnetoovum chiemensis]|nr:hypothetical protein MCHI_001185 [Candidatus Magnetoovum chiemensis]
MPISLVAEPQRTGENAQARIPFLNVLISSASDKVSPSRYFSSKVSSSSAMFSTKEARAASTSSTISSGTSVTCALPSLP